MNRTTSHPVTWFVSRHYGALEWARRKGIAADRWVAHLDPAAVAQRDTVIGSLPVNLAAAISMRGARYLHLSLSVPVELRGQELSADQLDRLAVSLEEFSVCRVDLIDPSPGVIR